MSGPRRSSGDGHDQSAADLTGGHDPLAADLTDGHVTLAADLTDGHATLAAASAESKLQRSSAAFLADLDRLKGLELAKRAMASDDPARPVLARSIEDLVGILLGRSGYQRRLADEGIQQFHSGAHRHPSAVLDDWRDAERRLIEGRSLLQRATDDAERYREEYRAAFAMESDRGRTDGGG